MKNNSHFMIRMTAVLLLGLVLAGFAVAVPVTTGAAALQDTKFSGSKQVPFSQAKSIMKSKDAATPTPTAVKTVVTTKATVKATTKVTTKAPTLTKTPEATKTAVATTPTKQTTTPSPTSTKVTYKNYKGSTFSLNVPSTWATSKEGDQDFEIYTFDSGKEKNKLFIFVKKGQPATLEDETDVWIESFISQPDIQTNFKIISSEDTTISGLNAKNIVATGTSGATPIKQNIAVIVAPGSKGASYLFWFVDQEPAYSGDVKMIDEIRKSMKITYTPVTPVPTKTPAPLKTYTDTDKRFSLSYPGNWEVKKNLTDKLVDKFAFIEPDNAADFLMIVTKNQVVSSLDERWKTELDLLKKNSQNYNLLETSDVKLGGNAAKKAVFTRTQDSVTLKCLMVMTVAGGREYSLTFETAESGYTSFTPTFEKVISSFKITAKPITPAPTTSTPTPTPTTVKYETYSDSRISVQYPNTWQKGMDESDSKVNKLLISSTTSPSTMGVWILKTGQPDTLVNLSKGWFEQTSPWTEGKKTDTKLSGLKATRSEFTGVINGKQMAGVVTITRTDKGAYWVYYVTEKEILDQDLPEYEKLLKSFKAKF